LDEMAADVDVVVFDEDDLADETRVAVETRELPAAPSCRAVARVGLAREDRTAPASADGSPAVERLEILEQQIRALVGGETAREADRQRIAAQPAPRSVNERAGSPRRSA
jgi:hypothetical protein